MANDQSLNEDVIRRRLNAQRKVTVDNDRIASDRKIELARLQAEQDREALRKKEEKRYEDLFKKTRDNPADIEAAIREINSYQAPTPKKLDENLLKKRVDEQYAKIKPEELQRLALVGVTGEQAIREKLTKQTRAEMEAALEVLNKPLFDEEDKAKLIQRAEQELSNAVQKAYKRVLDNPNLRIQTVLQTLGQIQADKRLFPEVQEALEREAKAIQERMAKASEQLTKDGQDLFVSSQVLQTGNPLIKQLADVSSAFEETQKKFAPFGKEFAEMMANIAQQDALQKLEQTFFQISDKALKYRQDARKLENLPETQSDAFGRRLEQVEKGVEFVLADTRLSRQLEEDKFYADTYSPNRQDLTFLVNKFGYTGVDRLTQDFQRSAQKQGESGPEYQKRINEERNKYLETSLKIKDAQEDLRRLEEVDLAGTGLYGKEAIAKARLDRLPSREELLPRLNSYGATREEAQKLLRERADAQEVLRDANIRKFRDFTENQRFLETNRKDVDERLANLRKSGLSEKEKLEQYNIITSELGNAELTPAQRQGKIDANIQLAKFEEKSRKEAEDRFIAITGTMNVIKTQLEKDGLKVNLGDQTITEVRVTSELTAEKRTRRATTSDAGKEY